MPFEEVAKALTEALNNHATAMREFAGSMAKGAANVKGSSGSAGSSEKWTEDKVRAAITDWLSVKDKDIVKARSALVVKLNKKYGVDKLTAAKPDVWVEAMADFAKLKDGKESEVFEEEDASESIV